MYINQACLDKDSHRYALKRIAHAGYCRKRISIWAHNHCDTNWLGILGHVIGWCARGPQFKSWGNHHPVFLPQFPGLEMRGGRVNVMIAHQSFWSNFLNNSRYLEYDPCQQSHSVTPKKPLLQQHRGRFQICVYNLLEYILWIHLSL